MFFKKIMYAKSLKFYYFFTLGFRVHVFLFFFLASPLPRHFCTFALLCFPQLSLYVAFLFFFSLEMVNSFRDDSPLQHR